MTRPEDFTVYQATDPGTAPDVLEQMAGVRADLRQFVAANPSTAPEVLAWLGTLGDPAVAAALARRSGSGAAWAAPTQGAPAQQPPPPAGPPAGGGNPYAPPAQAAPNPYAPPAPGGPAAGQSYAGAPYGQRAQYSQPAQYGQSAPFGQNGPYGAPQPGYPGPGADFAAAGYGYQPQPGASRKGLVTAIVVGAVVLVAALIFAATQIFAAFEGSNFGDDADLDQLWNECAAGDPHACDDLFWDSPLGSDYEEFGDTCGHRQPSGSGLWCRDVM